MIYLAQTDTTVGFLSKNLKELNIAKGRKLDQDCLITISKFYLLKDFVRVPVNFRNFVRRAKKTTIIYPNLKSFRVVKDCEHAKFLDKNGWFYSTSANKHGLKFDFKFAKKVANKIVFNDDGSKFVEGEASRIYRISKIKKRRLR
ncbi:Sua5 YciO YrdC YwlC family protein [Campylobacter sp. FMV-PI01]|uniref:Sua5 YciO YrdC YwlC family protein n=1 Tax=Campylobacter portucalensis TaxID=2608384 RepID=A0A6L5WFF4_9BACT|nr:Sua5 YciO YrdC YwlC family protein [Campylobacter portucalensis]MSN95674.1 Sua5 YciO YrdC YwlC family protein [Campylobacter portucalensis]